MTTEDFVRGVYREQKDLLEFYFSDAPGLDVPPLIREMNLTEEQLVLLQKILAAAFRDLSYTFLLGIDGAAQLGGVQHAYRLMDEDDNELSGGEIEGYAWEYFHGGKGSRI
ncbi:MAG: hypothetical protein EOP04_08665 [Proteobacteria bacterium]|nr:MAG: hypothetical protein EOP04_08665 [Pseudomonadota bacterium]